MNGKHKAIDSLEYTDVEKKTVVTYHINSWIDREDKTLKTSQLSTRHIKAILGLLIAMSFVLLAFYILYFITSWNIVITT